MEPIKITMTKEGKDIYIKNSNGGQIHILSTNNELKASDIIAFLDYKENVEYKVEALSETDRDDKNLKYVHELFCSIVDKINPVND